jgi:hypothetical protein
VLLAVLTSSSESQILSDDSTRIKTQEKVVGLHYNDFRRPAPCIDSAFAARRHRKSLKTRSSWESWASSLLKNPLASGRSWRFTLLSRIAGAEHAWQVSGSGWIISVRLAGGAGASKPSAEEDPGARVRCSRRARSPSRKALRQRRAFTRHPGRTSSPLTSDLGLRYTQAAFSGKCSGAEIEHPSLKRWRGVDEPEQGLGREPRNRRCRMQALHLRQRSPDRGEPVLDHLLLIIR